MSWRGTFRRQATNAIPGLDGLRAISILCVLYGHLLWVPTFRYRAQLASVINPAGLGVRLFFVISGFLITSILLDEKTRTGSISLGQFYMQRGLRIFPPYYAFLLCTFALAWIGAIVLQPSDYFYTLTYTFNMKGQQPTWWVGHTWSLAVEEQFYLLWPLAVRTLSEKSLERVALACAAVAAVGRGLLYVVSPSAFESWSLALPLVADPIALGAVLAIICRNPERKAAIARLVSGNWMMITVGVVLSVEALNHRPNFFPHPLVLTAILEPLVSIGLMLCVARAALVTSGTTASLLNSRALVAIGITSYSLYLWQMLFITPYDTPLLRFPLGFVWAAAATIASYLLIERPFNMWRKRLRTRAVSAQLRTVAVGV